MAIDQLPIDLRSRDSILKLHSLIHNQLSSKRFIPMIRYAWYTCGYAVQDPGRFKNVRDTCFSFDKDICSIIGCSDHTFICCSWCGAVLCFCHFFVEDDKEFNRKMSIHSLKPLIFSQTPMVLVNSRI